MAGGPETGRSEDAGQPTVVREQMHAPGTLADEWLRVAIGALAHGGRADMGDEDAAAQIVVADEADPIAVMGRRGILDEADVLTFEIADPPAIPVQAGRTAMLG